MNIVLSFEEIRALTGYRRPSDQLKALHRLGFYRARLGAVSRQVVLERDHYHAVCSGAATAANAPAFRPRVRV